MGFICFLIYVVCLMAIERIYAYTNMSIPVFIIYCFIISTLYITYTLS